MRKLISDEFKKKCAKELAKADGNIHTAARRLKCSASTVYRATGGKRRSATGESTTWVETARATEVKGTRKNGVGRLGTKANQRKAKSAQKKARNSRAKVARAAAPKAKSWSKSKRKLTPRAA